MIGRKWREIEKKGKRKRGRYSRDRCKEGLKMGTI